MTLEEQATTILYVLLAAFLSMLIGMERERRDKDAGLRTHMLVAIGASLFTSLSIIAFPDADTSRVASNIVTGVGFLGAGIIWRGKRKVHDLTTAASIWVTAALGVATGAGAWLAAIGVTLIVWLVLAVLRKMPIRTNNDVKKRRGDLD